MTECFQFLISGFQFGSAVLNAPFEILVKTLDFFVGLLDFGLALLQSPGHFVERSTQLDQFRGAVNVACANVEIAVSPPFRSRAENVYRPEKEFLCVTTDDEPDDQR